MTHDYWDKRLLEITGMRAKYPFLSDLLKCGYVSEVAKHKITIWNSNNYYRRVTFTELKSIISAEDMMDVLYNINDWDFS